MLAFHAVFGLLRLLFSDKAALVAENLALRQQLAVLRRSVRRPRLRNRDRIFWAWLSRLWKGWRSALTIVQPESVVKWHRSGFRLYWRWRSHTTGRPRKDLVIRDLIREMSRNNPIWGAPRIRAELRLLGAALPFVAPAPAVLRRWLATLRRRFHHRIEFSGGTAD